MTNVMHKFLIYLSIYFCLTCFGLSLSPSSEAGVQIRQWFKSIEAEVKHKLPALFYWEIWKRDTGKPWAGKYFEPHTEIDTLVTRRKISALRYDMDYIPAELKENPCDLCKTTIFGCKKCATSMVWAFSKNGRGKVTKRSYEMASNTKKKTRKT
jgi:hypothetical protein